MRLGQPSTNRMTIDAHFELNSALNQGVRLIRSYPLLIRHAARSECSEPSRWAQFVQLDQRKRPTSDFASASHAEVAGSIPAGTTHVHAVRCCV